MPHFPFPCSAPSRDTSDPDDMDVHAIRKIEKSSVCIWVVLVVIYYIPCRAQIIGAVGAWATVNWLKMSSSQGLLETSSSTQSNGFLLRHLGYGSLLGAETVVVLLTVGKAINIACRRTGIVCRGMSLPHRLAKVFNECGIWFYLCVLAFTLTDVLLLVISPDGKVQFDSPLRVMHTVLVCRLVLHLRGVAMKKVGEEKDAGMYDTEDVGSQIRSLRDLDSGPYTPGPISSSRNGTGMC
ncbi:hypothetical protein E1B28_002903 [Marasmius oreades]|uniref:Uncharacterized protein n=1 Tax=Marasmius oreades TaxID=181124 RepID=A0A9P7UIT6_9AGAR|nr:uncharacterized protein E1B28_002903 [Marasmius oreades]KAG7085337.1 hypothetical protein E1B28_002903 [Marasmius oreades]